MVRLSPRMDTLTLVTGLLQSATQRQREQCCQTRRARPTSTACSIDRDDPLEATTAVQQSVDQKDMIDIPDAFRIWDLVHHGKSDTQTNPSISANLMQSHTQLYLIDASGRL